MFEIQSAGSPWRLSIPRISLLALIALAVLGIVVVTGALIGVADIVESSRYMTSIDVEGGRFPYTIDSISARVGPR